MSGRCMDLTSVRGLEPGEDLTRLAEEQQVDDRHQHQHQCSGKGETEVNGCRHRDQELGLQRGLEQQRRQAGDGGERRQQHRA